MKTLFQVIDKNKVGKKEGVLLKNGSVVVGLDAGRLLNRRDFPSYELEWFKNFQEFEKVYEIFEPKVKPYYIKKGE